MPAVFLRASRNGGGERELLLLYMGCKGLNRDRGRLLLALTFKMPTKPLDRLLFAQGGLCFFCRLPLPKDQASVEHLVASSNGGPNTDDNCVACCVTVNRMFGHMSLKEKFQVVLNQKGTFECPNGNKPVKTKAVPTASPKAPVKKATAPAAFKPADYDYVLENLKQRGDSRPRTIEALKSAIATSFPGKITHAEVAGLIRQLRKTGVIKAEGNGLAYHFPDD